MQLSRNSNDSSWEVFDVTMAELDLRGEKKKQRAHFFLCHLQAVQSKKKKTNL